MHLHHLYPFLFLAHSCHAGPLIAGIIGVVGEIAGEVASTAIVTSSVAEAFGIGESAVWFGEAIIIDGYAYWGSGIVGAGMLAGGVGGVGGGAAIAVINEANAKKSAASVASASRASLTAKLGSVLGSMATIVHSSVTHALSQSAAQARASVEAQAAAANTHHTGVDPKDPFTFTSGKKQTVIPTPAPTTAAPAPATTGIPKVGASSSLPPPPGTPISSVPAAQRPTEIPAGVPEYNLRMCQYDIIRMGQNKQNLVFDQPDPKSIKVDNIPSTCMVLSNVLVGAVDGAHPVPMSATSLQWNDIKLDTMNLIRQAFGVPEQ